MVKGIIKEELAEIQKNHKSDRKTRIVAAETEVQDGRSHCQ